jgi:hypothetical protein
VVIELRERAWLPWLGLVLILPVLASLPAPANGQDSASPAPQAASEPAPNAAVTSRWPAEDSPPNTSGRALPSEPPSSAAASDNAASQPKGWSALLPQDSPPVAGQAARATGSKVMRSSERRLLAKSVRQPSARAAKPKSPRAAVSPRGSRTAAASIRTRASVAPTRSAVSNSARPARAAQRGAKPHRPLALAPPKLRAARGS